MLPERLGGVVDECLFVCDDVRVPDRGENAHLIERVFLLFVRKLLHPHLLQCVELSIGYPFHVVHAAVGTLT